MLPIRFGKLHLPFPLELHPYMSVREFHDILDYVNSQIDPKLNPARYKAASLTMSKARRTLTAMRTVGLLCVLGGPGMFVLGLVQFIRGVSVALYVFGFFFLFIGVVLGVSVLSSTSAKANELNRMVRDQAPLVTLAQQAVRPLTEQLEARGINLTVDSKPSLVWLCLDVSAAIPGNYNGGGGQGEAVCATGDGRPAVTAPSVSTGAPTVPDAPNSTRI
eukprot:gnl/Ergobibamus_cyprinoides/1572.p1 GENE.gnl/Ergobibamus_cyprinoides/1572~~gnl/Ergobibamus_cyprinoides/1572.p1  ORF type:complete len:254 (-),score=61.36 gnl/Ergobibamus_cyprinoides/1572:62-718(-)